jgi:pimeloyl-ACP methyl ester carboxylesterase
MSSSYFSPSLSVPVSELSYRSVDGSTLAGLLIGTNLALTHSPPPSNFIPILLLHGWEDNCSSFLPLVNSILSRQQTPHLSPPSSSLTKLYDSNSSRSFTLSSEPVSYCFACLDFVGHGLSSHLPLQATYSYPLYTIQTLELAVRHLKWEKFHIIAHSMGGAIGTFIASSTPSRVLSLLTLDSVTIWTYSPTKNPEHLERLIEKRLKENQQQKRRIYSSVDEAAEKYRLLNPFITMESARLLMSRGLLIHDQQYSFRHDKRLNDPSPHVWLEEHIPPFLQRLQAPVLFLIADRKNRKKSQKKPINSVQPSSEISIGEGGLDREELSSAATIAHNDFVDELEERFRRRIPNFRDVQVYSMPGDHHAHMDQPNNIAAICMEFIEISHWKSSQTLSKL